MTLDEPRPPIDWISRNPAVARVFGFTRAAMFEYAAEAMFGLIYDLSAIPSTYSRPIVAPGDTYDELLLNWLEELRFMSASESIVWSWFVVDRLEEGGIQGSAGGMPFTDVTPAASAVTDVVFRSHGIVEVPDGWWAELEFVLGQPLRVV